jgi:hypothetical protein
MRASVQISHCTGEIRRIKMPNMSLENRWENAAAFPSSHLHVKLQQRGMKRNGDPRYY